MPPAWEFTFFKPSDSAWHFNKNLDQVSRDQKAFPSILKDGLSDEAHRAVIAALATDIRPRTAVQRGVDWFVDRSMCFSSSSVDSSIRYIASSVGTNHPYRRHFQSVLSVIGKLDLFPSPRPQSGTNNRNEAQLPPLYNQMLYVIAGDDEDVKKAIGASIRQRIEDKIITNGEILNLMKQLGRDQEAIGEDMDKATKHLLKVAKNAEEGDLAPYLITGSGVLLSGMLRISSCGGSVAI